MAIEREKIKAAEATKSTAQETPQNAEQPTTEEQKNDDDDISKYMKNTKEESGKSYAEIKKAAMLKSQVAMATISGYTATQKSMIWFAGAFVNKYSGPDATAADKATTEDKK